MNNLTLTISDVIVRQDEQGRFNLNDLHKAAGSAERHLPSKWLQNQQTKALVDELRKSLIVSEGGIPLFDKNKHLDPVSIIKSFFMDRGVFVVEELVYAYAMWISPAFHLKVIRAYAALVKGNTQLPEAHPATLDQRMDRMENALDKMAGHMETLARVSMQQAQKLDVTARYIGLLEVNQKGKVKVTRIVEAQALALSAQGMPMTDIARLLRISRPTVSLLVNGKYPLATSELIKETVASGDVEALLEQLVEKERLALSEKLDGAQ